jgi:sodium/bile acid cotransporter 7
MGQFLRRLDGYSLLLLATVGLASVLPVVGRAADAAGWVVAAAITLLFFLHGAKLSRSAIVEGAANWRLHITVVAFTFGLFPLLGVAAQQLTLPLLGPTLAAGILFLTLLPSTVQSSIAFTSIAGGNVPAAICSASLSNVLGLFATPFLVALLMTDASGGISMQAVRAILFQLLLPFVAGHLARPLVAGLLARNRDIVGWLDRGSILLIVYSAFSAAVVQGLWHQLPIWQLSIAAGVAAVMLAVMLTITRIVARAAGFSPADEKVIVFCGSKKSLASGVPIAGALFSAAQVGALVLPLMIFHQLQLFACAIIAQRYARQAVPVAAAKEAGGAMSA